VGARLLDHCEAQARAAGAARIVLEVAADNPAAGFYLRRGFAQLGAEAVADEASGRSLSYLHLAKAVRT
jgi:ribosomal protein S18 acetylase RimI-like enzyme